MGDRMVKAPRRLVFPASGATLRRQASRRHLALLAAPPSTLTARALVRQQSTTGRSLKRTGDVLFSLAVLGLGSPVFLLLALLVKVSSPGPVFYVQRRVGRLPPFRLHQIRPCVRMQLVLASVLAESPEMREEFERDFKLKDDPRITPIGRFPAAVQP